jgi:dihydroorotate dehydrogenase (fumarate)
MADISTQYMGLTLNSPIIVGSCGLTNSARQIQGFEESGAGAVVLKSIFEEDIAFEYEDVLQKAAPGVYNLEQFDYYDYQIKEERLNRYLQLIEECKKTVSIPIIASVNCTYSHEWAFFAKRLEAAGADGLELNMFFSPAELDRSSQDTERLYLEIVEKVKSRVSFPVAVKMSPYFTTLGAMIQKLSNTGISALVLFNRFYSPDFDIDNLKVVPTNVFSTAGELAMSLRWIALMSKRVNCDLAASTGVHDGRAVIKQILAGAKAVQVVSALYQNGSVYIQEMLQELQNWMIHNEYYALEQFRGMMSQAESGNPAVYERFQFMRQFGGIQ